MSMVPGPNTASCMSSKKTNFNFNGGISSISSKGDWLFFNFMRFRL